MQFNQDLDLQRYSIRSYAPGEISVLVPWQETDNPSVVTPLTANEAIRLQTKTLTHSLIITPASLIADWAPQHFEELQPTHFATLAGLQAEVVIMGTGARLQWPDLELLEPLYRRSIGFEVMDTGAACRTYNILMYEGRRVAAALFMI